MIWRKWAASWRPTAENIQFFTGVRDVKGGRYNDPNLKEVFYDCKEHAIYQEIKHHDGTSTWYCCPLPPVKPDK